MKLTLWQQFSSNHSSSFTVVGRCESIEKAIEVEQILRTLLEAVDENNTYRLPRTRLALDDDGPTWSEIEIAEKYGIEWKRGIDWVAYDERDRAGQVMRYEQHVFLTNGSVDTHQGAAIPAKLMSRLADEIYVTGEFEPDRIVIDLQAGAPDEQIAVAIKAEIHKTGIDSGQVERSGSQIRLTKIRVSDEYDGLRALIEYLKDKGCTDIHYRFKSVPYRDSQDNS